MKWNYIQLSSSDSCCNNNKMNSLDNLNASVNVSVNANANVCDDVCDCDEFYIYATGVRLHNQ